MAILKSENLALPSSMLATVIAGKRNKLPRHKAGEKFLKGPIPLNWLNRASQLPGKSLHVAVAIWYLAGLNKLSTIKLNQAVVSGFSVTRHSKYRALACLEKARLISVHKAPGCLPVITILECTEDDLCGR
jgi:hypothetical protein